MRKRTESNNSGSRFRALVGVATFLLGSATMAEAQGVWSPTPGTTWQWQLTGAIDTSFDVEMYDIDLFETPQQIIDELHQDWRIVICYFSAGSWEDFRPDRDDFPLEVLGNPLGGFPDERWLDVSRIDLLAPIMEARLDLAVTKECDGVEPDNVDGFTNNSGFPLTYQDQLDYNLFIADAAHARGLSVGLKNDIEQISDLEPFFDWALNEQCFQFLECGAYRPFLQAGKAVFGVEYSGSPGFFCPIANQVGGSWQKKRLDLDPGRIDCLNP